VKISRQTREYINMALFLLIVAAVLLVFVFYPLNRTKALMAREGVDDYDEDSVVANDVTAWGEAGLAPDTFRIEADGLTVLAGLTCLPGTDSPAGDSTAERSDSDSLRGTILLLPAEYANRDSLLPLAQRFLEMGYAVTTIDQRATGCSTGKYHGEGQYEAEDLLMVLAWMDIRSRLHHPVTVVGFSLGGDAAILAAQEESRIDKVVAINPYLTSRRMQDVLKERHDTYWVPFYRSIMWWWYDIRSGYAAPYRDIGQLAAVGGPTLILADQATLESDEFHALEALSDPALLDGRPVPEDLTTLTGEIEGFIR